MPKLKWTEEHDRAMGKRIREAREAKGWSLQQLAERLNVVKASAGHWETGLRAIKHHDLAALCAELDVSADEIVFGVRRWPFTAIDFDRVARLDPIELAHLEGGLMQLASDLGLEILRPKSALVDDSRARQLVLGATPAEDAALSFGAKPSAKPHQGDAPVRKRAAKNAGLRDFP